MSLSLLPSGRWRAQVWDPTVGHNVSVSKVLGGPGTFRTKTEAKAARAKARERLAHVTNDVTVASFRERWTTDPLFARPKESTNIHNKERTKAFAQKYGDIPIGDTARLDAAVVEYFAGGRHTSTLAALRAMFNDAASAKAGRLTTVNPFADLGIDRSRGNRDKQPPTREQMEAMVTLARDLTPPSFAAYLEFACLTAIRPGELDALRWDAIDLEAGEIHVREQWNVKTRKFTLPKYGPYTAALVSRARDLLLRMPRDLSADTWVFTTIRGTHYTPSSRTHHWNRVRSAAGLADMTLYLATRHYFGWYAINVLGIASEDVAEQLGHRDGGRLVRTLYGHPDKALARSRIREAHDSHAAVRPLRVVRQDDTG